MVIIKSLIHGGGESAKEKLVKRKRKRQEWITTETWEMIEKWKTTRGKLLATKPYRQRQKLTTPIQYKKQSHIDSDRSLQHLYNTKKTKSYRQRQKLTTPIQYKKTKK